MSNKNVTSVNIIDIIKRARQRAGLDSDKQLAELMGISKENFSNRKRRGTLLPLLIEWAVNEKVNLQWLVVGEDFNSDDAKNLDPDPEIAELMEGARKVLTSGNPVAFDALERNIRYFSLAVDAEKRADSAEKRMQEMEKRLRLIEQEIKNKSASSEAQSSSKKVS